MKIAIAADHAGFTLKEALRERLSADGHQLTDVGTFSEESTDYPDFAFRVGKAVAKGRCDRGILVCGSGIGMSIAANKVPGVRAALVWSVKTAGLAAEHNRANVLCVPGRLATLSEIRKFVKAWLTTPADPSQRHERRVKKIGKFEAKLS